MGKLTNLRPAMRGLAPRIARSTDAQGHSKGAETWRAWYHLARWKHPKTGLRMKVLIRDHFTCQAPACGKLVGDTAQLVADHIAPHRGDPALFWCETNLETLCKPCHDGRKQALERRAALGRGWGGI